MTAVSQYRGFAPKSENAMMSKSASGRSRSKERSSRGHVFFDEDAR